MKDLSLFILKNSLSSKMKKGIQNFCSSSTSTSTLLQSSNRGAAGELMTKPPTLEEMIIQLELEEEEARISRLANDDDQDLLLRRRMLCVDGADIMKSARNALNQYPRFSLDGRDAMCRSSFKNFVDGRKSFCGSGGARLPATVAGERVMWCKPGVVAALMGLDAVPVPVGREGWKGGGRGFVSRKQSLRRMGKMELEKERQSVKLKNRTGVRREDLGICVPAFEKVPLSTSHGNQADWRFKRAR